MSRDWKTMAVRLRENQQKNLQDYAGQDEKSEKRIKALNELQNCQSAVLRAGRIRH